MGVVYCALDSQKGDRVAIKRLSPTKLETESKIRDATARLEQEYHTLAQLAHPSIIEVYDYGIDSEGPFYTMEYLAGKNLREQTPIPWREACKLLRDVTSSLAVLHSRRLIHRDVSAKNIQCSSDRRAKLIDFDAMMAMGPAKRIVGTPPYIAPEVAQQQALDGRTDLYALGATLYYVLTGRHAYQARDFRHLNDLWRSPVLEPSRLVPDIPKALEQLIFTLLSLSPAGRPRTAAEVFERLTAIAQLPADEHFTVAEAYLNTPSLVGRDQQIVKARRLAFNVLRRGGRSIVVKGEEGVGRSRFLDAFVLEAKLLGFAVLRADASDAIGTPFGAAQRLFDGLVDLDPRIGENRKAKKLKRFFQNGCHYALDDQYSKQEQVIEDLCELFYDSGISPALAIVVDDIHRIGEASLAFLATLSSRLQYQKLLVVLSIEREGDQKQRAAIELIHQVAHPIEITALSQEHCRELISSIFGDIQNLNVLSELAYRRCGGVPRDLMDAAQVLIDEKLLRYEAGNWVLSNDSGAIEKRLEQVSAGEDILASVSSDALEFLSVIAIDRDHLMDINNYTNLTEHRDRGRVHRALDELVQAHLLEPVGNRYRYVRRAQEKTAIESISDGYRKKLHLRIAQLLKSEGRNPVYQTYHFLLAGEFHRALDSTLEFVRDYEKHPESEIAHNPVFFEASLMLIERADSLGFVSSHTECHRSGVVLNAVYNGLPGHALRYLPKSIESISYYSGLTDYHKLGHLDESERLTKALELAKAHCEEGVSDKDFFTPVHAIQRISQLGLVAASYAVTLNDASLLKVIPDLTPLSPLSPVIGVVIKLIDALRVLVYGRMWDAWDGLRSVQKALEELDSVHLDEFSRFALFGFVLGYRCGIEVVFPTPKTRALLQQCEQIVPVLTHSYLASYFLSMGDRSLAESTRRQFEILAVQSGQGRDLYERELINNTSIFTLSNDLIALKRTLSALEETVKTRPLYKFRKALIEAHYLRCLGQHDQAITVIEGSLAEMAPNQLDWAQSVAVHIELLTLSGEFERAKLLGYEYLTCAKEQRAPTVSIELALALCLSKLSEDQAAQQHLDTAVEMLEEREIEGLYLARCYEVGARLAIERIDSPAFNHYAQKWAALYHNSSNPSLIALFDSLIREADNRHIEIDLNLLTGLRTSRMSEVDIELRDKLRSTLNTCNDPRQIYSDALSALVERSGAKRGVLYVDTPRGLSRVSASFETPSLDTIEEEIDECYRLMAKPFEDTTTVSGTEQSIVSSDYNRLFLESETETGLIPFLLEYQTERGAAACGLVLLAFDNRQDFPNRIRSVAAVAEVLSDQENVVVTELS